MNLEQQVCSLELAKRLKELGVKQESLFWWYPEILLENEKEIENNIFEISPLAVGGDWYVSNDPKEMSRLRYSAFTVAELGEMLLNQYHSWKSEKWICKFFSEPEFDPTIEDFWAEADTEADARAKMLIYLLENKLIK